MIVVIATAVVSNFLHTETDRNTRKNNIFLASNWEFILKIGIKGGYFGLGTGLNIRPW